ncbi:MAG: hypothetical protein QM726_19715 [Chitinophagaceae bacterium]
MSFEQYSFMGTGQNTLVAPVAHYETNSKWYAEARYNYEDINTVSLYAGHNFSSDKKFSWSFTPMAGIIAGNMKGGSFGLNTDLNYRKFYFSSQAQYSISTETRYDNFFYNWSELYYQPFEWMYTGVAVQHTRIYATNALVDPGLMLGFSYSQWSFPFYTFNPLGNQRYYVVGINWEWNHASRSHKKASPPIVNTVVK